MKNIISVLIASMILPLLFLFSCHSPTSEAEQAKEKAIKTDSLTKAFIEQGRLISRSSFEALSSSLMQAMKQGGVSYALQFCNVKANPIADSLSAVYEADIKRISVRNRSPFNQPEESDMEVYAYYTDMFDQAVAAGDTVVFAEKKATYYAPIVIAPQCLVCHGKVGDDMNQSNHNLITDLYPNDQAIGFEPGELRGLWKIGFTFAP